MRCPHLAREVCAPCRSRQDAVDRLARRLEREATSVHVHVDDARGDEPLWAATLVRDRSRRAQPFGLHGHERLVLVATACVAVLVVVTSLPAWARLLVLLTTMAVLFHTRGRPVDALVGHARAFVEGRSPGPAPARPAGRAVTRRRSPSAG